MLLLPPSVLGMLPLQRKLEAIQAAQADTFAMLQEMRNLLMPPPAPASTGSASDTSHCDTPGEGAKGPAPGPPVRSDSKDSKPEGKPEPLKVAALSERLQDSPRSSPGVPEHLRAIAIERLHDSPRASPLSSERRASGVASERGNLEGASRGSLNLDRPGASASSRAPDRGSLNLDRHGPAASSRLP